MALRPFTFGLRLRDKGRTIEIRERSGRYVLKDSRKSGPARQREHDSAKEAVKDAAATWRNRLH